MVGVKSVRTVPCSAAALALSRRFILALRLTLRPILPQTVFGNDALGDHCLDHGGDGVFFKAGKSRVGLDIEIGDAAARLRLARVVEERPGNRAHDPRRNLGPPANRGPFDVDRSAVPGAEPMIMVHGGGSYFGGGSGSCMCSGR